MTKVHSSSFDIFDFLKDSDQFLPAELSTASREVSSLLLLCADHLILLASFVIIVALLGLNSCDCSKTNSKT